MPILADEGLYLASKSSLSRVLRAHGRTAHRGHAKAPRPVRPPTMHIGSEPRQVWCWDIYGSDHSDHAVHLVRRTALAEGIAVLASKPVLHGGHAQLAGGTALVFPASGQ